MPTLTEWTTALTRERVVALDSSQRLIHDIRIRQTALDAGLQAKGKPLPARKAQLAVVPNLPPHIRIAPIHLLHHLGRITTPPIPNLVDLCSTWAMYRYLWAFEMPDDPGTAPLRLSVPALEIDFHQKGLMSDQLGVALAALVMDELFDAPHGIDVDVALRDPAWPIQLDSASPDYIFHSDDGTVQFVVECKGTRCGRAVVLDQLRRGLEQVPSLSFTDGRPSPMTLVIGAQLTADGTCVYIVDPPPDPSESAKRLGPREWRIEEHARFEGRLLVAAASKLASFALSDAAAFGISERLGQARHTRRPAAQLPAFRENSVGSFVGRTALLQETDSVAVEVFQGVEMELRARIEAEPMAIGEASNTFARKLTRAGGDRQRGPLLHREEVNGVVHLRSIFRDGSLLEYRLNPR